MGRPRGKRGCKWDAQLKVVIHRFSPGQRVCLCGEKRVPDRPEGPGAKSWFGRLQLREVRGCAEILDEPEDTSDSSPRDDPESTG